jgi:hypothetical protein
VGDVRSTTNSMSWRRERNGYGSEHRTRSAGRMVPRNSGKLHFSAPVHSLDLASQLGVSNFALDRVFQNLELQFDIHVLTQCMTVIHNSLPHA